MTTTLLTMTGCITPVPPKIANKTPEHGKKTLCKFRVREERKMSVGFQKPCRIKIAPLNGKTRQTLKQFLEH